MYHRGGECVCFADAGRGSSAPCRVFIPCCHEQVRASLKQTAHPQLSAHRAVFLLPFHGYKQQLTGARPHISNFQPARRRRHSARVVQEYQC